MRITSIVDLSGDIMTQEALDGLVGQECPVLRSPGDHRNPIGRATVIEASTDGPALRMTLDLTPSHRSIEFAQALVPHFMDTVPLDASVVGAIQDVPLSIGFTIGDAGLADETVGHRQFKSVYLRQVGRASMPFSVEDLVKRSEQE